MMDYKSSPTINEIVLNRPEKPERRDFSFSTGQGRFLVGDMVKFFFGAVIRSGRITNSIRRDLTQIYHIESVSHTWYRGIPDNQIISKLHTI